MKKILWLTFIFVSFCLLTLSSCKKPDDLYPDNVVCEHSFGDWVITKQANCIDTGELTRVCNKCTFEEKAQIATNEVHIEVITPAVAATCTTTGLTEGKHCSRCDTTLVPQTVVNSLGHTEVIDNAIAATCTETGLTEGKHCSRCNETIIEQTIVAPLEHNFTNNVCSHCGDLLPSTGLEYSLNEDGLTYSVTGIGNCTDAHIVIPELHEGLLVTQIGYRAFYRKSITSITIPDSITSIGWGAFNYCYYLTNINVGKGVNKIDEFAFSGCEQLVNIAVSEANIAYKSIDGNLYTKNGDTLVQYAVNKPNQYFTIPDGITSIGGGAFYYCDSLVYIFIPDSVLNIGALAFGWCSNLTLVIISNSVTSIGRDLFTSCSSLTDIFYTGSEEEWNNIIIADENTSLLEATIYYYNEENPHDGGNWWRYIDGVPRIWESWE